MSTTDHSTLIAKKVRALQKKLRGLRDLEEEIKKSGKAASAEQQQRLGGIPFLERSLKDLQDIKTHFDASVAPRGNELEDFIRLLHASNLIHVSGYTSPKDAGATGQVKEADLDGLSHFVQVVTGVIRNPAISFNTRVADSTNQVRKFLSGEKGAFTGKVNFNQLHSASTAITKSPLAADPVPVVAAPVVEAPVAEEVTPVSTPVSAPAPTEPTPTESPVATPEAATPVPQASETEKPAENGRPDKKRRPRRGGAAAGDGEGRQKKERAPRPEGSAGEPPAQAKEQAEGAPQPAQAEGERGGRRGGRGGRGPRPPKKAPADGAPEAAAGGDQPAKDRRPREDRPARGRGGAGRGRGGRPNNGPRPNGAGAAAPAPVQPQSQTV